MVYFVKREVFCVLLGGKIQKKVFNFLREKQHTQKRTQEAKNTEYTTHKSVTTQDIVFNA